MIKYYRKYLLVPILFLLVGCSNEPMIQLSEERQQEIEQKLAQRDAEENAEQENTSEVASDNQEQENVESTEEVAPAVPLVNDPSSEWEQAETGTSYNLWDYAPYLAYQIKQFINGAENYTTYMNYNQNDNAQSQIQLRRGGTVATQVFSMGDGQIRQVTSSTNLNPYDNVLSQIDTLQANEPQVLLQEPLTVGTTWSDDSNYQSEITALYNGIETEAGLLTNVVEVTRTSDTSVRKDYYAQNQGFVAMWSSDNLENQGEYWRLTSDTRNVMLTHPMNIYEPDDASTNLVKESQGTFAFQTNGSLASAFQQMFREIGIIDDTIMVNNVYVDSNNVAIIDFTPGVVAVFNNYDASEEAVINSIVYTMGEFFQTNQVRLTVNGNGLLPNSITYPEGGIYNIQLEQEDSPEENNEAVESVESVSQPE
ncbi:GerMN domain-containing protein [Aerococcaceae bacterium DSM 111022]|nr:GerMN domain-containing protein [Aerococcaceae bacterium DSM 111022]